MLTLASAVGRTVLAVRGIPLTPETGRLDSFVFHLVLALWVRSDRQARNFRVPFEFDAFVFFAWLVPPGKQPEGVRNAKSRVVLENTGEWLQALLPQDMDNYLSQLLKKKKGDDQEPAPETATPGQRSDLGAPLGAPSGRPDVTGSVGNPAGYQRADRNDMRQLIDATTTTR